MYDHLLSFAESNGEVERIDLFIYGIGGRLEVPWRIVTMIREFCDEFNVIIPYKAYSAATLIALGSDNIIMGRKGELSPIDPTLHFIIPEEAGRGLPQQIGVEDVSSYIKFIKERVGLTDQDALVKCVSILAEKLTPPVLGQVQRAYSHIRLVARKLLSLHRPPMEEGRITNIVEALTEKIYLHGHGIGRKEAKDIGLQVIEPNAKLEELIWKLYLAYEELLKMNTTSDPLAYFKSEYDNEYREPNTVIACIESRDKLHVFEGELLLRKVRRLPPQPVININMPLQLPPGISPKDIPREAQLILQQLLQQAANQIREIVLKEIIKQSPIERIEKRFIGGRWVEKTIN